MAYIIFMTFIRMECVMNVMNGMNVMNVIRNTEYGIRNTEYARPFKMNIKLLVINHINLTIPIIYI
jgi:hypothetical protein